LGRLFGHRSVGLILSVFVRVVHGLVIEIGKKGATRL
jgi:hypothetical protein